jgi:hypothetical protein
VNTRTVAGAPGAIGAAGIAALRIAGGPVGTSGDVHAVNQDRRGSREAVLGGLAVGADLAHRDPRAD